MVNYTIIPWKGFPKLVLLSVGLMLAAWTGVAQARPPEGPAAQKTKPKKEAAQPAKPAEKKATSTPSLRAAETSLRDPFKLPPKPNEGPQGQPGDLVPEGPLPPGSRGLIIGQLKLEGIVRQGTDNPKMIAVLANPANRAYFLHVNDPLYNGVLTKITPDSVYFREDVRDESGKMISREVVKKLAPASGEKK